MVEIADAELELRQGFPPSQILENEVILTRIYWGYYTAGGMGTQYELKKGEELILKPDTENDMDCFAIKVYNKKGKELGFIRKELASAIISIHQFTCKVAREMDITESIGWTKNSFWVGIYLIRKM